ncbi:DUF1428 domain-containing protein [Acetobacterium bakii]|uniref:RNA signal recognition particle 4.5S RNA n=1 Tax=Acetobacterium bakii TaxID=52689 RepID=A0A0L6U2P9_9FIRM|nr:DUF1428 domain-containing protein [Acetobacterium bakii]KNZ42060.1 RNA signal recognition particle 4.5S RNA [Acetobacterium bakii]
MEKYVDGFVIPIKCENIEKYRKMAEKGGEIWMEHGALAYVECIGDDLNKEKVVPFTQIAGTLDQETVIFSWIVYESKEHRDQVMAAVMADPKMNDTLEMGELMPFNEKRMTYGGFKTLVYLLSKEKEVTE